MKKVEASQGESITTDSLLLLCRQCGLSKEDLEDMTIGMCLDYIDEYVEMQNPKKKKARRATQSDYDAF